MAQNTVQYQRGLSLPELFDRYGSQEQCEDLRACLALARGLYLLALPRQLAQRVSPRSAPVLPVQRLPLSVQPGGRHRL